MARVTPIVGPLRGGNVGVETNTSIEIRLPVLAADWALWCERPLPPRSV